MAATALNDTTAIKLAGLYKVNINPWADEITAPTGDGYDLDEIEANTMSVTKDSDDETTIDRETDDTPIKQMNKLGKFNIAFTACDVQAAWLALFGYTVDTTTVQGSTIVEAPTKYMEKYFRITLSFGSSASEIGSVVLPKVRLFGAFDASSLKDGMVKVTCSGTAYKAKGAGNNETLLYVKYPTPASI